MRPNLLRSEAALLVCVAALLGLAMLGPAVAQAPHYHIFADTRTLWGLPRALDVLTNVPFALLAMAGAWLMARVPPAAISNVEREMTSLFLVGLLLVAGGSSWYHVHPNDAGVALDRQCMAVALAGVLGLAVACRVSARAGAALGLGLLVAGPLSVQWWVATGNLLPWAVLQGAGMLLLAWVGMSQRPGALQVRWWGVLLAYALGKVMELQDAAVYELTRHMISGHSLKHLFAAAAALPILAALARAARCGQNAHQPDKALTHREAKA